MKNLPYIFRLLLIAPWPIIFLLMIGPVESYFMTRLGQTFDLRYRFYLALIYLICGGLFAARVFFSKPRRMNTTIVITAIITDAIVVLFSVVWLIQLFFGTTIPVITNLVIIFLLRVQLNAAGLIFGYSFVSLIRNIYIIRR